MSCPHCKGKSGYQWKDYGKIFLYKQYWGGTHEREVVEILDTKPEPVFAKCIDCGKQVMIVPEGTMSDPKRNNHITRRDDETDM